MAKRVVISVQVKSFTSMDCDGTKAGYDIELTRAVAEAVSVPVIVSGGAGTMAHFMMR